MDGYLRRNMEGNTLDASTFPAPLPKADDRGGWGGKLEFFLTLVGFAVGLGNVWRFPYLAYSNGGGAFLLPYALMLLLMGIPLFFMEVVFGQFASLGPVSAWKISPFFKGVGVAATIVDFYIVIYYNVVVAWCLYFLFSSMAPDVPWKTCNNWWNTPLCRQGRFNASLEGNITAEQVKTPSEEFFYNKVLQLSEGIDYPKQLVWQLVLCLLLAWIVIYLVLIKGIGSLGKVSYVISIVPYFLLTVMLVRGSTLDGARSGIEFYVKPNFTKLMEAKVWGDAATQICYSLGVCQGCLIAMSSYNKFHNNARRDALLIPFINCGTSFYAGFVIFSVLGYMANNKGVTVDKVAASGPGLVFVVYPEGLAQMPVAPLWSCLFFFMMCCLGFSSQFTAAETTLCVFLDEFPELLRHGFRPQVMRAVGCTVFFLLGLPLVTGAGYYWFKIMDEFSAGYTLLAVGFFEFVCINYFYGHKRFAEDIAIMLGHRPGPYWVFTWCFLGPVILVAIIIFKALQQQPLEFEGQPYPPWAQAVGWLIVAFPLVGVPAIGIYQCLRHGGYQALKRAIKPSPDWGPALPENRLGTVYEYRDKNRLPMTTVTWPDPPTPMLGRPKETDSASNDDTGYGSCATIDMKNDLRTTNGCNGSTSYNTSMPPVPEYEVQTRF